MFGWGWGWNPLMMGANQVNVSTTTNGTLFIDLIDAKNKELVWQGVGEGYLSTRIDKKEERIKKFTSSILTKYPPEVND
jgi:hypothetical protein